MGEFDEKTLLEQYGCDPWDEEHFGRHPASRGSWRARKPKESIEDYLNDVCPEEE
jgi:hypothetical protein